MSGDSDNITCVQTEILRPGLYDKMMGPHQHKPGLAQTTDTVRSQSRKIRADLTNEIEKYKMNLLYHEKRGNRKSIRERRYHKCYPSG